MKLPLLVGADPKIKDTPIVSLEPGLWCFCSDAIDSVVLVNVLSGGTVTARETRVEFKETTRVQAFIKEWGTEKAINAWAITVSPDK